jgi:hypothetical protein
MIGKAAHIHGASSGPGSRRYLKSMSREERRHISNAIWLCSNHADMIDRDEATYTGDELRAMKREHENNISVIQRNAILAGVPTPDYIAIGPDIVFTGDFIGIDNEGWSLHLRNFFEGDIHTLITFIERFEQAPPSDRYVLMNHLGDGRVLKEPPSITKDKAGGYIIRCSVLPGAERIDAADIPKSWALSDSHDPMVKEGNWTLVSGLDALPQQIKTCLSLQKGESPLHREFGTRIAEYYSLLSGSPWFDRYLKLEVIRQASIPYVDPINNRQYTPLLCVERVFGIEVTAVAPTNNWLPVRVDLDVKGVGRWRHELFVCVPQGPVAKSSLGHVLGGSSDP